jgi:ribosomal protein L7/L12
MLFGIVLDVWDYFIIMIILSLTLSGLTVYIKPKERSRLKRIEAKLDVLLRQAGVTYDPLAAVPPEVIEAIKRNEKMEAVKLYRKATGVPLAEAVEYVEDLMAASPKI